MLKNTLLNVDCLPPNYNVKILLVSSGIGRKKQAGATSGSLNMGCLHYGEQSRWQPKWCIQSNTYFKKWAELRSYHLDFLYHILMISLMECKLPILELSRKSIALWITEYLHYLFSQNQESEQRGKYITIGYCRLYIMSTLNIWMKYKIDI